MTSRNFLKVGLLSLAVLCVLVYAGSSASAEGTKDFTSTNVGNHTHTFTMDKSNIDNPPAEGISGKTSEDAGHTHTVTLTTDDLTSIKNGGKKTITTSVDSGHSHKFTFSKWY